MCLEVVFFRMSFCGPFCGPFCATESTEKAFSVHKNTFSVLSVAQNCADTKTEGTSEKVFGCGAHPFDVLRYVRRATPAARASGSWQLGS
jgi:hypothetical protein